MRLGLDDRTVNKIMSRVAWILSKVCRPKCRCTERMDRAR